MVLHFDTPAKYSIRVAGLLDNSWSDLLGGMTVINTEDEESGVEAVTTLTGPLIDQAALLGVLNALYNMHYSLLSVEYLGSTS